MNTDHMPKQPLLSIIIPTKDRYETLIPVVKGLLSQISDSDFEVVIRDNSANNYGAAEALGVGTDTRLRYFYESNPVSIVDNTVAAIEQASGRFLCFIGDDDIVAPYIVDETRRLSLSKYECLAHTPAYYWWPSVEFAKSDFYKRKCALWAPHLGLTAWETLDAAKQRAHTLRNGSVSYYKLPRFYHGIVSRRVLDEIKQRTGTYVPGASPDMAFAMAISLVIDKYLYTAYPITIFGASRGSGGGRTVERSHHGRLENQVHLPKKTISQWDTRLPRYWSEYTIYPQTVQEVLGAFASTDMQDFISLYASIFVNEPWLTRMTWPFVRSTCGASPSKWSRFFTMFARRLVGRAYRAMSASWAARPYDVVICADVKACMLELERRYSSVRNANAAFPITT